jgi:hypothetical protein
MDQVQSWRECLAFVSYKHVYREHNMAVDKQSKDGVQLEGGMLKIYDL